MDEDDIFGAFGQEEQQDRDSGTEEVEGYNEQAGEETNAFDEQGDPPNGEAQGDLLALGRACKRKELTSIDNAVADEENEPHGEPSGGLDELVGDDPPATGESGQEKGVNRDQEAMGVQGVPTMPQQKKKPGPLDDWAERRKKELEEQKKEEEGEKERLQEEAKKSIESMKERRDREIESRHKANVNAEEAWRQNAPEDSNSWEAVLDLIDLDDRDSDCTRMKDLLFKLKRSS